MLELTIQTHKNRKISVIKLGTKIRLWNIKIQIQFKTELNTFITVLD